MRLIDTHAHLDFDDYNRDREEVFKRAREIGVEKIVNIGADLEGSRRAVELAEKYDDIYAAVGIHPHEADSVNQKSLAEIIKLAASSRVKAIGECGLDFYYDNSPRQTQKEAFKKQLDLALELKLPVVVHSREAIAETLKIIDQTADFAENLIFHCYAYGPEEIEEIIKRDYYVAFGGLITFKNAQPIRDALKKMPLNRILLETDAPYLTPAPNRGKRNEPAYLEHIVKKAAEVKGIRAEEMGKITTENAERIYNF
ncbi:TatD DNase family protein [Halanaerobium saccharolyticum]|uniref:TatD DNase family protein n=1 Tax=Halanaerobium saccharolyticum TaxID=43595 RepID=A0A4R7YY68_9FIRM|nr:TatD family hydrolase [Halanaerobium saccharolyticum]RAK06648.1 TatD DNase family protein [Halanaerobium saccharolyticum]TDW01187.1 TatD DNase family protein [Halanaerobium saccharolyticum]TDX51457.1 TatD DNase family protein [Halanaerobium saccharolyticum]